MNKADLKAAALQSGFHLVGIAPALRFPEADAYQRRLESGYAADMTYLARNVEKRLDPRVLFPAARSVIVCGLSYHSQTAVTFSEKSAEYGQVSRYALGEDYHHVLKQKLFALLERLQKQSAKPLESKICVDTVPILERLCGYYAGLGWIGKNGMLINPRYGSWFFLGEILLNVDLEYDAPQENRCGTCTRCLDACPTGALVAPRTLDARRCLSYLTIELRGAIPETLRPALKNKVFGCDCCQEVCPWNQQAEMPTEKPFSPQTSRIAPELTWLASLSAQEFKRLFKHTPLQRGKLRGLLRNTAVAMGNSGQKHFLPHLESLLAFPDPLVRSHVEWAIRALTAE